MQGNHPIIKRNDEQFIVETSRNRCNNSPKKLPSASAGAVMLRHVLLPSGSDRKKRREVVIYDEHVKHWPDINGGCTDYCTYKPKVVKVPL